MLQFYFIGMLVSLIFVLYMVSRDNKYLKDAAKKRREAYRNKVTELTEKWGEPDVIIPPGYCEGRMTYEYIIISNQAKKIFIGGPDRTIGFEDIASFDYSEEELPSVAKTNGNTSGAIGRGVIGGIVGGGVGAIVGAGTAPKQTIITPGIKRRTVWIYLNDLSKRPISYTTFSEQNARRMLGALKCII